VGTLALLALLPYWFPQTQPAPLALTDSLLAPKEVPPPAKEATPVAATEEPGPGSSPVAGKGVLFPFDPNTLDAAGWQRLGLPDRTTRTLLRYREKGGRFRQAEDLRKVWGLPAGFYERVQPYIRIAESSVARPVLPPRAPSGNLPSDRHQPTVQINDADSAAWEALPGIGAILAGRIIRFRERLGGFYSVDQVAETFGLADSTFRRIRPLLVQGPENSVLKFNLNTASREQLLAHPYIRRNLANALIEYRNRHGAFQGPEDLKRVHIVTDSVLRKLTPYIRF